VGEPACRLDFDLCNLQHKEPSTKEGKIEASSCATLSQPDQLSLQIHGLLAAFLRRAKTPQTLDPACLHSQHQNKDPVRPVLSCVRKKYAVRCRRPGARFSSSPFCVCSTPFRRQDCDSDDPQTIHLRKKFGLTDYSQVNTQANLSTLERNEARGLFEVAARPFRCSQLSSVAPSSCCDVSFLFAPSITHPGRLRVATRHALRQHRTVAGWGPQPGSPSEEEGGPT